MRRTRSIILAVVFLITALPISSAPALAADAPFADLDGIYAKDEIVEMYGQGIYKNLLFEDDAEFLPRQPITRVEF